jgi:hypothetical protein
VSRDARFAIYFAPRLDSPLAQKAAAWFADPDSQPHTVSPRHYGFHATLKPPFALNDGQTPDQLRQALQCFAAEQVRLTLPPFTVNLLGNFIALTLSVPSEPLNALAARCVQDFDYFRRPAVRPEKELSPRQRELLAKWGYPYVLDEWKFHMTLTSSIPDKNTRQIFLQTLKAHFSEFTPVQLTDLCIFMQPDPATPFALMDRFPCLKQ